MTVSRIRLFLMSYAYGVSIIGTLFMGLVLILHPELEPNPWIRFPESFMLHLASILLIRESFDHIELIRKTQGRS